jgi:hypothetical protein
MVLALSLPFYFFEHRSERLRCDGAIDYNHCSAGTAGTLVLGLGLIGSTADVFYVKGIYARHGYSAWIAKIGGLWIPLLLLCVASLLAFRAIKRPKALTTKLAC